MMGKKLLPLRLLRNFSFCTNKLIFRGKTGLLDGFSQASCVEPKLRTNQVLQEAPFIPFIAVLCFAALTGCKQIPAAHGDAIKSGVYTAVCRGFYGDFDVSVTVKGNAISAISSGTHRETPAIGGKAIGILTERIIAANTSGVDGVSGATITSAAFKTAVLDCLRQAGAGADYSAAPAKAERKEAVITSGVLVMGSGAAGLSAAIAAAENGAKVTLIEKQDITGGSTVSSAGIVYAAADADDSTMMVNYYIERAEGKADREMLEFFAEHSLETISFLENAGVRWKMTSPAGTAPELRARFSMHEDGTFMIGSSLTGPLEKRAREAGVTILTGVRGTELILDARGRISGAKAVSKETDYTFNVKALVLATGGFDASEEMKTRYSPAASGDFPLSSKGNTGDGINMGIAIGADTEFNGGVIGFEIVDGSLPHSGYNAAVMFAPLFVMPDGSFAAFGADYPVTYTALKKAGGENFFAIYDAAGEESAKGAISRGFGRKGATIDELAKAAGMDAARLRAALKKVPALETPPYFAVRTKTATIGSMGGLVTNVRAEVLKKGSPIPGLYAAGETANGSFYYREYPASGSSNSLSVTFGREAGKNAAAYIKK